VEANLINVKFVYWASSDEYLNVSTFMHLFRKFWLWDLIKQIRDETNCYDVSLDDNGRPHGCDRWYPTMVSELQIYISVSLYIGMK
jgi:hypothetical protein